MRLLGSLLLLFAYACSTVSAQSVPEIQKNFDPFIRQYNERRAENPDGLLFTVKLKDNRKQFHLGEIITLELSFAASKPETFTLDAATYDRSGRLHSDGFALDPREGVVDPLHDYFNSGLDGFMMGGLRGIPDLTNKPYLISVELNEWQRIDKPGHYRMYVVSSRVGKKGRGLGIFLDNGHSPVVSNVIEFDVLPSDKKWARQKLNEAIFALAKVDADRNRACRTLRFLGTIAAATEMRKRFSGDDQKCEWEYKFGLIGSPHRDFIIRDMENAISLREQAVTSHFIRTLALLEFARREAGSPRHAGANEEEISAHEKQRRELYDQLLLQYLRQLVPAISLKHGQARATSLQTLLDYRSQLNTGDSSQWSTLLASMPEVFNRLPLDNQLRMLKYQWKPIASAAMLPVLREVLKYSYTKRYNSQQENLFSIFEEEDLRGTALRRIYELSPEEGQRLILEEIRRAKPRVNENILRSLPVQTLPELNAVLLTNLEESRRNGGSYTDAISELIERYATDEILLRVRAVYEAEAAGKWECRTQAALLAYFLRVAPSTGREHLKKALAVRDRGFAGCYVRVLNDVAALHMSTEVEDVATTALDDDNSEVLSQAASVLSKYGSADAEKALWRRLEKWHEEATQSRDANHSEAELSDDQEKIEKVLREALTNAEAWLLDLEKLKRLRELCLTEKSRDEVDRIMGASGYQIYVAFNSFEDEPSTIGVAHYKIDSLNALKKKLLQFPKGTLFKLKIDPPPDEKSKADELFQQINSYLAEHGMKLTRALEPK